MRHVLIWAGMVIIALAVACSQKEGTDIVFVPADTAAPGNVTGLSGLGGDRCILLSWNACLAGDLAGYRVYCSSDNGASYTCVNASLEASATSYRVDGLINGVAYRCKVACYDDNANVNSGSTVTVRPNPPPAMYFSSGLVDGGMTGMADQELHVGVPNPGSDPAVFGGTVELVFNDQVTLLTPAAAGSGWESIADLTLAPGHNTLLAEIRDSRGALYAATPQWSVACARLPAEASERYTLQIEDIDPAAFPLVTLDITVQDFESAPVSGLAADDFSVSSAGRYHRPVSLVAAAGSYRLSYRETSCGQHDLYAFLHDPATGRAGRSDPGAFGCSRALLVGIEDYPGSSHDLTYAVDDVDSLQQALTACSMWSAADITRLTREDPGGDIDILAAIRDIAERMQPGDALLFHFSGHGSSSHNTHYLCTVIGNDTSYISVAQLNAALSCIPNPNDDQAGDGLTNVFVLLDACFSGGFVGKAAGLQPKCMPSPSIGAATAATIFARDLAGDNVFVMTASSGSQPAYEDSGLAAGIFTHFMVHGLTPGAAGRTDWPANRDHDNRASAEECFAYIENAQSDYLLNKGISQEPQYRDNDPQADCRLLSEPQQ